MIFLLKAFNSRNLIENMWWSPARAIFCQFARLSVILTKLKLEYLKSDFKCNKGKI